MTNFRPYEPDQQLLLPPSLRDWIPPDHLVWFISETVDQLDLSEILDGSKIRANASKRKAMSYERMQQEEKRLRREIRALTGRATKRDAAEDVEFGPDFRGDQLPEELQRREDRLAKIREAKRRLEARKRDEAKASEADEDDDPPKRRGRPRKHIAEPPFGWVKRGLGFRQFSLRGLRKVAGEFNLVCMAMNLRRMANMIRWA